MFFGVSGNVATRKKGSKMKRIISPKYRLDVEFENGIKISGQVRKIILSGHGKIRSMAWQGLPVPVDALKYLDDGVAYVVNVP